MIQSTLVKPISFIEALRRWLTRRDRAFRSSLPGMIESYDPDTCTASVKPLVMCEDEEGNTEEYGVINEVPVVFPRSKDFMFSFPLQRGDGVLLVFADFSLDAWKSASAGQVVKPQDSRTHHLSDAVAIPGMYNLTIKNPVSSPSDCVSMQYKKSSVTIKTDGSILIGPTGGQLKKVVTEDALSALSTHTHPVVIASLTASPSVELATLAVNPANVTAKVKLG